MTRKDFIMLSDAFKHAADSARAAKADLGAFIALDDCASRIADTLTKQNKTFDRKRFMDACAIVAKREAPPVVHGYDNKQLSAGQRVELHPAQDLWMKGACFGDLVAIQQDGRCLVKLDRLPGSRIFNPTSLRSA